MDIVGPLPKSSIGHRYILVILDDATRYPSAQQQEGRSPGRWGEEVSGREPRPH